MTPEEVGEAYRLALIEALKNTASEVPATALLQFCLALQEALEEMTQSEPTARPATRLVTDLAAFARLANEAMRESQRKQLEEIQRRYSATDEKD